MFFVNIDTKILNKTSANQIWQYSRMILPHDKIGSCPEMQGWLNIRKSVDVIHHIKS